MLSKSRYFAVLRMTAFIIGNEWTHFETGACDATTAAAFADAAVGFCPGCCGAYFDAHLA